MLRAEQLEKRELLAADLTGAMALPPDSCQLDDVAVVQGPAQTPTDDASVQPRERSREDCDTGGGAQKRPRDRDSQDDTVTASTSLALAAVDSTVDDTQPQEQNRVDADSSPEEDAALKRPRDQDSQDDTVAASTSSQLSAEEIEDILFVREEEKLARDVYWALAEKWDAPIFANIAQAEQQHMDAVGLLIERYDLDDPIKDDTPGVFTNDTLGQLYSDLTSSGEVNLGNLEPGLVIEGGGASQLAAYRVGAFIEEFDILDIQHALEDVTHSDVENVYENLLKGSRNHLRSFVGQIEVAGDAYAPVMMTGIDPVTGEDLDVLYLEILSGNQETANGRGSGQQRGQAGPQGLRASSGSLLLASDEIFAGYGRRSGGKRF